MTFHAKKPPELGMTRAAQFLHKVTARRHSPRYYRPAPAAMSMPSLSTFAAALPRGVVRGDHVYFSLPGRKKRDRSCSLCLKRDGTDFLVNDHHRDAWHWKDLKDYVRERVGLPRFGFHRHERDPEAIKRSAAKQNAKRKAERAARRKTPLRVRQPWNAGEISRSTWYRRGNRAADARRSTCLPAIQTPSSASASARTPNGERSAQQHARFHYGSADHGRPQALAAPHGTREAIELVRQNPPSSYRVSTRVVLVIRQRGSTDDVVTHSESVSSGRETPKQVFGRAANAERLQIGRAKGPKTKNARVTPRPSVVTRAARPPPQRWWA
jgi:hypothetical protein